MILKNIVHNRLHHYNRCKINSNPNNSSTDSYQIKQKYWEFFRQQWNLYAHIYKWKWLTTNFSTAPSFTSKIITSHERHFCDFSVYHFVSYSQLDSSANFRLALFNISHRNVLFQGRRRTAACYVSYFLFAICIVDFTSSWDGNATINNLHFALVQNMSRRYKWECKDLFQ